MTNITGDVVAQSVQYLTTDWINRVLTLAEAKEFSSSLSVQTSYEAHPASYPMGTRGPFPGLNCGRDMTLTTQSFLLPRPRVSRNYYTSSPPWYLHGSSGTALLYSFITNIITGYICAWIFKDELRNKILLISFLMLVSQSQTSRTFR
jgi:hypothetical protein